METAVSRTDSLRTVASSVDAGEHDSIIEEIAAPQSSLGQDSLRSSDGRGSFYLQRVLMSKGDASVEDLEEALKEMDEDGNGLISFEEFFNGLCKCGLNPTKDVSEQIFDEIDDDHSGAITFDELVAYLNELDAYEKDRGNKKIAGKIFCYCTFLWDSIGIFAMILLLYQWREDKYGSKKHMCELVNKAVIWCAAAWVPLFGYTIGWPLLKLVCGNIRRSCWSEPPSARDMLKARRFQMRRSERTKGVGTHLKSTGARPFSQMPASPMNQEKTAADRQSPSSHGEDAQPPDAHPLSVPAPLGLPNMLPLGSVPAPIGLPDMLPLDAVAQEPKRHQFADKSAEHQVGRGYDPLRYAMAVSHQMHLQPVHFSPLAQVNGGSFTQEVLPHKVLPPLQNRLCVMELS